MEDLIKRGNLDEIKILTTEYSQDNLDTALYYACKNCKLNIAEYLFQCGAKITKVMYPLLNNVIYNQNIPMLDFIINNLDGHKCKPLLMAVMTFNICIIEHLLNTYTYESEDIYDIIRNLTKYSPIDRQHTILKMLVDKL